jgi:D-alanyl-D-alanine carboxypeptidase (penicillin-binding protein 5/6)
MRQILLFFACVLSFAAQAQLAPQPPTVAAKSWLLLDAGSGQVLASHNPDTRAEPASLTKLMSAYLVFAALKQKTLKPDQVVPVSTKAWKTGGSRTFIEPDKPVTVEELLNGMIVQSGNDASVALAEAVAGSEEVFAQMMTREAQRLGLKNSSFTNSTGLSDPQHYTTARDLALLAAAIIRDFPEYYTIYSKKEYTYNRITQPNRNRLLWLDPTVDGVKTGHTETAGYCLVASSKRGPRRLISVVMGTSSENVRAQESLKLLNYGFQFFDTVVVYKKGEPVRTERIWKGAQDTVKIGFQEDLVLSLPKGQAEKIKAEIAIKKPMLAPVSQGTAVGTLKLAVDDKPLGEYPLLVLEAVPAAGIFGRTWDSMRLWFQ